MARMGATNSHIYIARTFGCTRQTIIRLFQRVHQTGQTVDRPRNGRPRVTTPREDRYLRVMHLRNRFLTMTSSGSTAFHHRVSRYTVSRRLRAVGIRCYRPFRGMFLSRQHRQNRQQWARTVQRLVTS